MGDAFPSIRMTPRVDDRSSGLSLPSAAMLSELSDPFKVMSHYSFLVID